jgi:hypothetical protein
MSSTALLATISAGSGLLGAVVGGGVVIVEGRSTREEQREGRFAGKLAA